MYRDDRFNINSNYTRNSQPTPFNLLKANFYFHLPCIIRLQYMFLTHII